MKVRKYQYNFKLSKSIFCVLFVVLEIIIRGASILRANHQFKVEVVASIACKFEIIVAELPVYVAVNMTVNR
jgi:hypothetical protein